MTKHIHGTGSSYQRSDGRWAAAAMYEGKRITKYGKTEKEAWSKLQEYLDKLKKGEIVTGPKQTVEQYLTYWFKNVHRLQIEPTSFQSYGYILRNHLIPAFGKLQLTQLTRNHIQKFCVDKLDAGFAPATIAVIYALLSAALKYAVENDILSKNPCVGVKLPKKVKHKPHVLNEEECKRLVAAAKGHRLWFLILVASTTGLRLGELLALHWDDFDLSSSRKRQGPV